VSRARRSGFALALALALCACDCAERAAGPAAPAPPAPRRDELAPGRFLLSAPTLNAPLWARSVVLMLQCAPEGSVGLIVNRPTALALGALLPDVEAAQEGGHVVYLGGPVGSDALVFLVRADEPPEDASRLVGDVFVLGSHEAVRRALESKAPPGRLRAYAGHAAWAPGQLEAEIERGDWRVVPGDPDLVFAEQPEGVWEHLDLEYGGVEARGARPQATPGANAASARAMRSPTALAFAGASIRSWRTSSSR
jgi:putative transcriptional regulator